MELTPQNAQPKPYPRLWVFPIIACFILLLVFSARKITDYDLGFHLKSGEWIVQHHLAPSIDTYTYGAAGHEYVDAHCFYQVLLYGFYKWFGYSSLTLLNMAVIALVFVLLLLRIRLTQSPPWLIFVLLFVSILMMETRFIVRPEVVSWLFLGLTFYVLELNFQGHKKWLWLLPVLQFFWANMEGLFILGWALCGAYFISGWFHGRKIDKKLAGWTALSIGVDFLNLNFVKGILFPFSFIGKLQNGNIFKSWIFELHPSWPIILGHNAILYLKIYALFSLLLFPCFILTIKKRKIHEALVLAAFFYLSCAAFRNISIFMVAVAPIAAACFKDLLEKHGSVLRKIQNPFLKEKLAPVFLCISVLLLSLWVFNDNYYISQERDNRFGFGLDEANGPYKATDFLVQNHLTGRIYNHLNLGGWLDWKAPQQPFIDGRLEAMGEGLFREFLNSFEPGQLSKQIEKYHPQMIMFEYYRVPLWDKELTVQLHWRPIYVDGYCVIYAAPDYAPQLPDVTKTDYLKTYNLPALSMAQATQLLLKPKPSFENRWFDGFLHRSLYPVNFVNLFVFSRAHEKYEEAQSFLGEALRQSEGRIFDSFYKFGLLYLQCRKFSLSTLCMERALELRPGNEPALKMLGEIFEQSEKYEQTVEQTLKTKRR